jgi:type II secretory pathway pseudopilin PulG
MLTTPNFSFNDDSAENSIMQTITIAVSAILIAAGLVTAPGLINNARDNNATGDLANVAFAQEGALSVDGKYHSDINPKSDDANALINIGSTKFTLAAGTDYAAALTCDTPTPSYLLRETAANGTTFYRSSASSTTSSDISKLTIADCITTLPGWSSFVLPVPTMPRTDGTNTGSDNGDFTFDPTNPSGGSGDGSVDGSGGSGSSDPVYGPQVFDNYAVSDNPIPNNGMGGSADGSKFFVVNTTITNPYTGAADFDFELSTDGGKTFSSVSGPSDTLINASNYGVSNNGELWIMQAHAVYLSSDNGNTWTKRTFPDASGYGSEAGLDSFTFGPTGTITASDGYGSLYVSNDNAATWQIKTIVPDVDIHNSISISSSWVGNKLYIFAPGSGVQVSTDKGNTFTQVDGISSTSNAYFDAASANGQSIVVTTSDSSGVNEMVSTDGGATWKSFQMQVDPFGSVYVVGPSYVSNDGQTMYLTGGSASGTVFVSTDGGKTFTFNYDQAVNHQIKSLQSNDGVHFTGMNGANQIVSFTTK